MKCQKCRRKEMINKRYVPTGETDDRKRVEGRE